jgi:GTPase SAR1 family protein
LKQQDTPGCSEFDQFRPSSYPNADVFLICFAFDDPDSLRNVKSKWFSEVRHHCPSAPIVLVGTKSEFLHDDNSIQEWCRKKCGIKKKLQIVHEKVREKRSILRISID